MYVSVNNENLYQDGYESEESCNSDPNDPNYSKEADDSNSDKDDDEKSVLFENHYNKAPTTHNQTFESQSSMIDSEVIKIFL